MKKPLIILNQTSLGFTLIELLIAISIIGIAFGVMISSSAEIQRNSRDAQRKSDLRNIQSALQQYYADLNYYPETLNLGTSITISSPTDATKVYLKETPKDPSTGNLPYCYIAKNLAEDDPSITPCDNSSVNSALRCQKYTLFGNLERAMAGADPLMTCNTKIYNYKITPI